MIRPRPPASPVPARTRRAPVSAAAADTALAALAAFAAFAGPGTTEVSVDARWIYAACATNDGPSWLQRAADLPGAWANERAIAPGERWRVPTLAHDRNRAFFRLAGAAADGGRRFDFGPGPVASGYVQVRSNSLYQAATGYGWSSLANLDERNRTSSADPLRRDFVFTKGVSEFRADIPDGTYRVIVTVGDSDAAQVPMNVRLNGLLVASGLVTSAANDFAVVDTNITVTGGQLAVGLAGVTNGATARMNALEILDTAAAPAPPEAAFATNRFAVSPITPRVPDWGTNRVYHHTWFFPRFADADGDGNVDVLYFKGTAEQTAYRTDGTVIWRYQDTTNANSLIRADCNVPIFDFDLDGAPEIACVRAFGGQPYLCLVRLADGALIRRATNTLDVAKGSDYHLSIVPAQVGGPGQPWSILVHKDYDYIALFDLNLNQVWRKNIAELGHTTSVADIDGDGRHEFFTGTRLYDHDGSPIWEKPELLDGTGEDHPDSNPIVDVDGDGVPELFCGPGARLLRLDGSPIWSFQPEGMTEVQSVRVLNLPGGGQVLALTDLPQNFGPLYWRGLSMRDVRSVTYLVDRDGREVTRIDGMHTPAIGDWDGDGYDELIYLSRDGLELRAFTPDGALVEKIPIQHRVYISDMVPMPVLSGAVGDQLLLHEWSADFTQAEAVIYRNLRGYPDRKPFSQTEAAYQTAY